jgi:hypothetical protein
LDEGTRSGCSEPSRVSLGISVDAVREIDVRKGEGEAQLRIQGSLVLSSFDFDELPLDRRRFSLTLIFFSLFFFSFFCDTFPGFLNAAN